MKTYSKTKAYCLRVPKTQGKEAISLVSRQGQLDRTLKIKNIENKLYIPLRNKPTKKQIVQFKNFLPKLDVLTHFFLQRDKTTQSLNSVLRNIFADDVLSHVPRSIDFVGNIAIVKLNPELLKYKKTIGQAIIKNYNYVHSVISKSSTVSGNHRLTEYEVIAGSENTTTLHVEYGCKYYLNPQKVFFSNRLANEHMRIASLVRDNETVLDMFAGIGPFSVLIAKNVQNVKVYAVDINSSAISFLKRNIALNKVFGKVVPILGDVREVVSERLFESVDRVIMNLPGDAKKYIGVACDALKKKGGVIHYYEFINSSYYLQDIKKEMMKNLQFHGRKLKSFSSSRKVKEISPSRIQFTIDLEVC
jgi:tRNA (guanine37-N1)-methyltransferase